MASFYVGQPCVAAPVTFSIGSNGQRQPMRGEITYVHPLGRYVTVAFETAGGIIRESFHPLEVRGVRDK